MVKRKNVKIVKIRRLPSKGYSKRSFSMKRIAASQRVLEWYREVGRPTLIRGRETGTNCQ